MTFAAAARPRRSPILHGRFGRTLAILAAVLTASLAAPAVAQPGSDGMPKPITAREINDYARLLGLTPMQRAGIDPVHDAYKADHQRLRASLIDPWLKKQADMNRGGPSVTRDSVKELLDDQELILTRVAALDARFFDQMVPLLTPDQLVSLPRVRLARERARSLSSGLAMAFGGNPADLSMQIAQADFDLAADSKAILDGILVPYERRLTKRMIELDDASRSMIFAMIEAMDEAGLLGMSQEEMMADPEQLQAAMQVAQQAFMAAGTEAREIAVEIAELNGKAYAQLMRSMPPLTALRIRELHVTSSAGGGSQLLRAAPSRPWAMALGIEDLEPSVREQLETGLVTTLASEEPIISSMLESVTMARVNVDPMNFDPSVFETLQEEIQDATKTLETRQESAVIQIAAILGETWEERLRTSGDGDLEISSSGVVTRSASKSAPFDAVDSVAMVSQSGRMDEFVPGRITDSAIRRLAQRLELGEGDQSILDLMHDEYTETFRALPSRDRVGEAIQARYMQAEGGDDLETRMRNLQAARRAARNEIAGLDEQFFDELDATFGGTDAAERILRRERLVRQRERAIGTGLGQSWSMRGGGSEGNVDLLMIVRGTDLGSADRDAAEEALDAWLETTAAMGDRMLQARFDLDAAQVLWQQRMTDSTMEERVDPMSIQSTYEEIMSGPSKRIETIRGELAELNRSGFDTLQSVVSADARVRFKRAWDRASFPQVYNDPLCVIPHMERALALDGIDASQRDELTALLATYRSDWQRLSDEVAARFRETSVDFGTWQDVDWVEVQRVQRELEESAMHRSERSIRTANRLRVLLTADQLASIGGLPDPDDESAMGLFSGFGF